MNDIGEGFAFFRWRAINQNKYIVRECHEQMTSWWPIKAEWPAEKRRREAGWDALAKSVNSDLPVSRSRDS